MEPADTRNVTAALAPVLPAPAMPEQPARLHPPGAKTPMEPGKLAHKLLQEQLDSIDLWANRNRSEARRESFWFWALKVPVIVSSAGYGLMLSLNFKWQLAAAGAVSAACVLIDGLYRPGNLRNFHHRASFELRMLAVDLSDKWKAARLRSGSDLDNVAAQLIEESRNRKAKIAGYLSDAEATLGKDVGGAKAESA